MKWKFKNEISQSDFIRCLADGQYLKVILVPLRPARATKLTRTDNSGFIPTSWMCFVD